MKKENESEQDTHALLLKIENHFKVLARQMEASRISDYIQLMNKPWRLILSNFIYGISRGIGIAVGFTIFAATILYFLRILGALDLPIVGNYIAEIVKIVQGELEGRTY